MFTHKREIRVALILSMVALVVISLVVWSNPFGNVEPITGGAALFTASLISIYNVTRHKVYTHLDESKYLGHITGMILGQIGLVGVVGVGFHFTDDLVTAGQMSLIWGAGFSLVITTVLSALVIYLVDSETHAAISRLPSTTEQAA